jgi:hypothetical protein
VLDVSRQRVTDDGLAAIVGSMPRLRDLAARYCEVQHIEWLATEHGDAISRLDLGGNAIGDDGVRALAAAPRLRGVSSLALDVCEVTGEGVEALAASPAWHELRELDLSGNPLGVGGAVALAGAPRPARLHALRLADVDLDAEAAQVLAGTPWLDQLAMVDLSRNAVTIELVRALTSAHDLRLCGVTGLDATTSSAFGALWRRAWRVDLRGTAIGDAFLPGAAPELYRLELGAFSGDGGGTIATRLVRRVAGGGYPRLRRLDLGGAALDDAVVAAVVELPLRDQLAALGLSQAQLSEAAVKRVADTRFGPQLRVLDLSFNPMDEATMLHVAHAEPIRHVQRVLLFQTGWPRAQPARDELTKRFGTSWHGGPRAVYDPEHDEPWAGPTANDEVDE